jgi:hypothetical protein
MHVPNIHDCKGGSSGGNPVGEDTILGEGLTLESPVHNLIPPSNGEGQRPHGMGGICLPVFYHGRLGR